MGRTGRGGTAAGGGRDGGVPSSAEGRRRTQRPRVHGGRLYYNFKLRLLCLLSLDRRASRSKLKSLLIIFGQSHAPAPTRATFFKLSPRRLTGRDSVSRPQNWPLFLSPFLFLDVGVQDERGREREIVQPITVSHPHRCVDLKR